MRAADFSSRTDIPGCEGTKRVAYLTQPHLGTLFTPLKAGYARYFLYSLYCIYSIMANVRKTAGGHVNDDQAQPPTRIPSFNSFLLTHHPHPQPHHRPHPQTLLIHGILEYLDKAPSTAGSSPSPSASATSIATASVSAEDDIDPLDGKTRGCDRTRTFESFVERGRIAGEGEEAGGKRGKCVVRRRLRDWLGRRGKELEGEIRVKLG